MNEFEASNGAKVWRDDDNRLFLGNYARFTTDEETALREFFRAEEDERLGRWRSPGHPDYVVYPLSDTAVRVVNERDNSFSQCYRGEIGDGLTYSGVGAAYFDAHPPRKPWHDAKPGEVWALVVDGGDNVPAIVSGSSGLDFVFTAATNEAGGTEELRTTDPRITYARRIWA